MPTTRLASTLVIAMTASLLLASPNPAAAQFRWRGEPLPDCRSFLITEAGMYYGFGFIMDSDIGYMTNITKRSAVGGALHCQAIVGGDAVIIVPGVAFRYRHWLGKRWAIDVSPRIQWELYDAVDGEVEEQWYSPTFGLSAGVGVADLVGVGVVIDSFGPRENSFGLGVRLGSYPAAAGSALLFGLLAASLLID